MAELLTVRLAGPLKAVTAATAGAPSGAPARARRIGAPSGKEAAQRASAAAAEELQAERRRLEEQRGNLERAARALTDAARQLRQLEQDLLAEAEGQLLELALQIARRVLAQEIQAGRYQIEPIVAEALRRLPAGRGAVVRLNGDDFAQCRAAAAAAEAEGQPIRFVADPNIRRAECRVEMAEGVIESAVDGQLAQIAEALGRPE